MDAAAPGPRDLPHRAGLQPARRRAARRLRSAAALLILLSGGCGGGEPPREDFLARFLAMRWDGLGAWTTGDLVAGLRRYVELDHPIYTTDDPHCGALHEFLYRAAPDPASLLALFAPHGKREVDGAVLRRDVIASTVATTFIRRIAENPADPHRAALYDALALAGVYFAGNVGLALVISVTAHTQQQAVLTAFFLMMPFVLLSGFMFPVANMPTAIQYATWLNPMRWFLDILRGIVLAKLLKEETFS